MEPWRRNFYLVWLNNFITAVGMMAFLPLFPFYVRELGVEDPGQVRIWAGVLVAGAPLTASVMGPFWGALSDRVGRRWMLVRANFAISVFVGCMGLVDSPWVLLLLRLGQGTFSGFIPPSMTLVSVAAPVERQGRVVGMLHTGVLTGSLIGPLIGGFVADTWSYRAVYGVTATLSAVAMMITILFVREPTNGRPKKSEDSPEHLASLFRQVLDDTVRLFRMGPLRWVLMSVFAIRLGSRLVEPNLGIFIEGLGGVSEDFKNTATGLCFAAMAVATLAMTPYWGRQGDLRGPTRTLAVCALGAGLLYFPMALLDHVVPLYGLCLLAGCFLSGVFPAAYAVASRHSSVEQRGGAFGITFSSIGLANAVAPAVGGVLAAHLGLRPLFVVSSVLLFASAWAVYRRRQPKAGGGRRAAMGPDSELDSE